MKEKKYPNKKGISKISIILICIIVLGIAVGAIFLLKGVSNSGTTNIFDVGGSAESETSYSFNNKENYIAVKNKEGKYGFIDTEGNQKIDFKYISATDFVNGVAIVRNENNQIGIIDINENAIIKFGEYEYIYRNNESLNIIKKYSNVIIVTNSDGTKQLLNSDGKLVTQNTYEDIILDSELICFKNNGVFGILNEEGKEIFTSNLEFAVKDTCDFISILSFDNCNKIINNVTGKVFKEVEKDITAVITKYGEYYKVQNNIIKDNQVIYSADKNHRAININNDGILYLIGLEYPDIEYSDIYYNLESNKKILEVDGDEISKLLNSKIMYQNKEEDIYSVDKDGERVLIENSKKLVSAVGENIAIFRNTDNTYSVMNIETKEYMLEKINYIDITDGSYAKGKYYNVEINSSNDKNISIDEYEKYMVDNNLNTVYNKDTSENLVIVKEQLEFNNKLTGKNYIIAKNKQNKIGIIDIDGNKIIDFSYDSIKTRKYCKRFDSLYCKCASSTYGKTKRKSRCYRFIKK